MCGRTEEPNGKLRGTFGKNLRSRSSDRGSNTCEAGVGRHINTEGKRKISAEREQR